MKKIKRLSVLSSDEEGLSQVAECWTPFFSPLHAITTWTESETTIRRITVAIRLPTGIGTGIISAKVLDGGIILELIVDWSQCVTELGMLYKKWLCSTGPDHIEKYHPRYLGFACALKAFREHKSDSIQRKAHLPLPFAVEKHVVSKHNLSWKNRSVLIVYIDLKAHSDEYSIFITWWELVWNALRKALNVNDFSWFKPWPCAKILFQTIKFYIILLLQHWGLGKIGI